MSAWQPIDTAPKDGSFIDLWMKGPHGEYREADAHWEPYYGMWVSEFGHSGDVPCEDKLRKAIAWMPIPDGPPEEMT
ncbi:hypothetical protein PLUTO_00490 [Luteibacter phage vB_LflM-Pluto]|uniref:DUF551 domain-containing protein n=1 Tax=Luteibacter phage vB_LflM-Pluto TaxID=2948611 RepID=A0A9E7MTR1_9CAUD|nr:hypothetical protein PLUTO_00490 [Luteibacter phage vB_LflM-Pluto]